MIKRIIVVITLIFAAFTSNWFLNRLTVGEPRSPAVTYNDPDFYMEDFTTVTTDEGVIGEKRP